LPDPLPPLFDADCRAGLSTLLAWRRDVRRFRPDALPEGTLERLLALADLAPSVGNAQPWRFVLVEEAARRRAIKDNFARANAAALAGYDGTRAARYAGLKLEGLDRAPTQIAVFCDEESGQGHRLGRATMPETLAYSTVCAIHTLWLAARAEGIGLGWLSILDPGPLPQALSVPQAWRFVAYLCLGLPEEEHLDPELQRHGWQPRTAARARVLYR